MEPIERGTYPHFDPILRALVDAMPDGVMLVDERGYPVLWNGRALELLGPQMVRLGLERWPQTFGLYLADRSTLCPLESFPLFKALSGDAADEAEIFMRSSRMPHGAWLRFSAKPFVFDGTRQGAILTLRDITREKDFELRMTGLCYDLERQEGMYRSLVTNLPGAVYRCDAAGDRRMRFVTGAIQEVTGYEASEFLSGRRYLSRLAAADDARSVERVLREALSLRQAFVMEYRIVDAAGSVRWVHDKGRPVFGEDGSLLWIDGMIFDVTERKAAEAAVLQKTSELSRAEAEKEQLQLFAFIASHDLRAPLQKVLCAVELIGMEAGASGDSVRKYAEIARSGALRLGGLLDDILQFTRAATAAARHSRVDLESVIGEVLSDLEVRMRESGAKVHLGRLPALEADRVQIRQLFQNLIGNAIKFGKPGSSPEVTVEQEGGSEGFVVISVRDNGIGFDPSDKDRIFKPFERLRRSDEYEGSGIGLAICRKIVERHGGRIDVKSRPGEGSVFSVCLPAALGEAA